MSGRAVRVAVWSLDQWNCMALNSRIECNRIEWLFQVAVYFTEGTVGGL